MPIAWKYADVVFSLAEKVDGAVSLKYQLPGEDLDPDALISIADDGDVSVRFFPRIHPSSTTITSYTLCYYPFQELFDEYFRALKLPGTPVKTFRLCLFLFRAAEVPYTLEDLEAEARYLELMPSSRGGASILGIGSDVSSTRGTGDEYVTVDGVKTPSTVTETELAWEAGFKAGQEAAMLASDEQWAEVLSRRVGELAQRATEHLLGAEDGGGGVWGGGYDVSPPPSLPAPGVGAVVPPSSPASGARSPGQAMSMSVRLGGADASSLDPSNDPEFQSMFESKYERASRGGDGRAGIGAGKKNAMATRDGDPPGPEGGSSDHEGNVRTNNPMGSTRTITATATMMTSSIPILDASADHRNDNNNNKVVDLLPAMMMSPATRLPTHISIFGDDLEPAKAAATVARFGPPPAAAANLPSHISEFGGSHEEYDEDEYDDDDDDGDNGGGGVDNDDDDDCCDFHTRGMDGGGRSQGGGEEGMNDEEAEAEAVAVAHAALPAEDALLSGNANGNGNWNGKKKNASAALRARRAVAVVPVHHNHNHGHHQTPYHAAAPPEPGLLPTRFDLLDGTTPAMTAAAAAGVSDTNTPHNNNNNNGVVMPPPAGVGEGGLPPAPPPSSRPPSTLSSVHQVDSSQLTILAKIGEGSFGEVSLCQCPTFGRVAVKWIKSSKVERWASFWREAELMSRLNHPNVLRFFGLVTQGEFVVGIMTEFAASGSLSTFLRTGHAGREALPPGGGASFLPLAQRAQLALHAANGMAYLHSQKIVHFDVKPDNLLVDGDWTSPDGPVLKVADFGLSVVKANTFCSDVHDLRGTLPYMAPEMITDHKHVTEAADVWSLGVVFWELLTQQQPYADIAPAQLLGALGSGTARLPIPEWCEPEWRAVVESCWVEDPALRPTCRQLALQLQRIRDLCMSRVRNMQ